MKKSDATEQVLTRRKALGRIGLFATAAYTVPAFATLSMAHASSGASSASDGASAAASSQSEPSEPSGAPSAQSDVSEGSGVSEVSDVSEPSGPSPSDVEEMCGSPEDANYLTCLKDNGWEGFVQR